MGPSPHLLVKEKGPKGLPKSYWGLPPTKGSLPFTPSLSGVNPGPGGEGQLGF